MPHPEDDVDDLEDDMSHLLVDEEEKEGDDDDKENHTEESANKEEFKNRIEAIMKATEADGVDRDEELQAVVAEMLAAAGPDAAAAFSKEIQAHANK